MINKYSQRVNFNDNVLEVCVISIIIIIFIAFKKRVHHLFYSFTECSPYVSTSRRRPSRSAEIASASACSRSAPDWAASGRLCPRPRPARSSMALGSIALLLWGAPCPVAALVLAENCGASCGGWHAPNETTVTENGIINLALSHVRRGIT